MVQGSFLKESNRLQFFFHRNVAKYDLVCVGLNRLLASCGLVTLHGAKPYGLSFCLGRQGLTAAVLYLFALFAWTQFSTNSSAPVYWMKKSMRVTQKDMPYLCSGSLVDLLHQPSGCGKNVF
jgi:hypothetical protein